MPDELQKTMLTYTADDGQRRLRSEESTRQVSGFKQYRLLLSRNLTQIARVPISIVILAIMAVFQGYI